MRPESPVEAAAALLGSRARRGAPLGALTTYRVGGPAALLVEVGSVEDLADVASAVAAAPGLEVLVVGRGSNLLVADAGFDGLAVVLGPGLDWIEMGVAAGAGDPVPVRAGAATTLPVLARRTAAAGLRGFEWAVGVPGSVGGAVRMNAGGHGSDMAACVVGATVVALRGEGGGEIRRVGLGDLAFGYRSSALGADEVVVAAELSLRAGDPKAAQDLISEIVRWRREHQPGGPNAGSVFTNPEAAPAGRLIESVGMKGVRHGSAVVSPKHANFIQVDDSGSADDVRYLLELVRERVAADTGIHLATEVRMVGFA